MYQSGDSNRSEGLVYGYLTQGLQYFSASKSTMLTIADMVPQHAANAAEKLMTDARVWVIDAGVDTTRPRMWLADTPLFRALMNEAAKL